MLMKKGIDMTYLEKQMFRHYIYGKVNEYYMFKEYRMAPGESYKEFKVSMTFSQLGLSEKHRSFFLGLIRVSSVFEVPISIFIIVIRTLHSLLVTAFKHHQSIEDKRIILNIPCRQVNTLFKKASIDTKAISVVSSPYCKNKLFDNNWGTKISLYSCLNISEVLSSFLMSCKMTCFLKSKYGYRDCMFRAYSSFEYFLCYYFFEKLNKSNTVFFVSTNDRWVYLFGHLKCKKIFLEHGALNPNKVLYIMARVGNADEGYYFNEVQRDICNRYMFCSPPKDIYFSQMEFTANDKLLNNGKKHILLVCELVYFYKEKRIIEDIVSTNNYNLYVKPHPQNNPIRYKELQDQFGFVLLGKYDLPAVDYVIYYDSTLVLEYQGRGVKTLMYEDPDYESEYKTLLVG